MSLRAPARSQQFPRTAAVALPEHTTACKVSSLSSSGFFPPPAAFFPLGADFPPPAPAFPALCAWDIVFSASPDNHRICTIRSSLDRSDTIYGLVLVQLCLEKDTSWLCGGVQCFFVTQFKNLQTSAVIRARTQRNAHFCRDNSSKSKYRGQILQVLDTGLYTSFYICKVITKFSLKLHCNLAHCSSNKSYHHWKKALLPHDKRKLHSYRLRCSRIPGQGWMRCSGVWNHGAAGVGCWKGVRPFCGR